MPRQRARARASQLHNHQLSDDSFEIKIDLQPFNQLQLLRGLTANVDNARRRLFALYEDKLGKVPVLGDQYALLCNRDCKQLAIRRHWMSNSGMNNVMPLHS